MILIRSKRTKSPQKSNMKTELVIIQKLQIANDLIARRCILLRPERLLIPVHKSTTWKQSLIRDTYNSCTRKKQMHEQNNP